MEFKNRRIAIIGAGPGGLTLARILQKHGLKPVIYEREPSSTHRQQGGTLDLHPHSGQKALKEAGLFEQFESKARYEGQDLRILDKMGKAYLDFVSDDNDKDRPEIDRGTLRELLINSIHPDSIHWGYDLLKASRLENGRYELHFQNGYTDTVDLVVGADGAFSRIRRLITDVSPKYTGISMIELSIDNVEQNHPDVASFNRRGSVFAYSDHKGISAQLNGDGRIRVYLSLQVENDWLDNCGIPFDQPELAKPQLLNLFEDWNEELKRYIQRADGIIIPRRLYMLPVGYKWTNIPGVTLIGDAAHLMSPFAGQGANLAMLDATELALSLITHEDINQAIKAYEEKMFVYSTKSAEQTYFNLQLCFSDNGSSKFANHILQLMDN